MSEPGNFAQPGILSGNGQSRNFNLMASVTAKIGTDPYWIEIKSATGNLVIADEPSDKGGKDRGMSPKELLAAALSACTSATLRMYIEKKQWDIPEIVVQTDLDEADGSTLLSRKIFFNVPLTEKQRTVLMNVANTCPVHKILAGEIKFRTSIEQG